MDSNILLEQLTITPKEAKVTLKKIISSQQISHSFSQLLSDMCVCEWWKKKKKIGQCESDKSQSTTQYSCENRFGIGCSPKIDTHQHNKSSVPR